MFVKEERNFKAAAKAFEHFCMHKLGGSPQNETSNTENASTGSDGSKDSPSQNYSSQGQVDSTEDVSFI